METVPQADSNNSRVMCFNGNTLRKGQSMTRALYEANNVGWGGGITVTNAFFVDNVNCGIRLAGKYSAYWGGSYMGQATVRITTVATGATLTYNLSTYTNNASNHVTIPFDISFTGSGRLGWNNVIIFNSSGLITDGNDQLWFNVSMYPAFSF
jgi:hypothetical protein